MMTARLAWREIRNNRWFSVFFVLNFAVGLTGFITLDGFKRNLQDSLRDASRNLALGDVIIASRRPFEPAERTAIDAATPPGTVTSVFHGLYSMAAHGASSALIDLRAVDEHYPLYGYVETARGGRHREGGVAELLTGPRVWVAPEILTQLDARVGDTLRIGDLDFTVSDTVTDESAASFSAAAYAPRAFIGLPFLEQAGLIRKGSTIRHVRAWRLPADADATAVAKGLKRALPDPAIAVRSHEESRDDSVRVLTYTNDYLGLVSIVALFLSGLGAAYLFRGFLQAKRWEVAILMSLGRPYWRAVSAYILALGILALAGAAAASLLSVGLLPAFSGLVRSFTPVALAARPQLATVALGTVIGIGGSLLICLPFLWRHAKLRPASLFQEANADGGETDTRALWLGFLPAVAVFYGLSVWQAHSWKIGSAFFGGFLASALVLLGVISLALAGLEAVHAMRPLPLKLATRYLTRHRSHAVASFLAISLGILLLNLIPQLRASLAKEMEKPADVKALPSLFLFDIQEEQKDAFAALGRALTGQDVTLSPLIRARLTAINGQPFQRDDETRGEDRDDQESQRTRNRGLNLSYREGLDESETISSGRAVSGRYEFAPDKPAEVTVEEQYASRMGLKVGDALTVEVQEVPITGRIVGLRKVTWNSFKPNFFIQFQPGALDDAPKTFLAAVPAPKALGKSEVQTRLVRAFPNVSVIDVERLIAKILAFIDQLAAILSFMALLCLAAGLVVLFSIASQQARTRTWDINMLKVLGLPFGAIRGALLLEFLLLGLLASLLGGVLSIGVSYVLSAFVFESVWYPDWWLPLLSTAGTLALIAATVALATGRVVRAPAALHLAADR